VEVYTKIEPIYALISKVLNYRYTKLTTHDLYFSMLLSFIWLSSSFSIQSFVDVNLLFSIFWNIWFQLYSKVTWPCFFYTITKYYVTWKNIGMLALTTSTYLAAEVILFSHWWAHSLFQHLMITEVLHMFCISFFSLCHKYSWFQDSPCHIY
jgi:hypothetical protein